jgi:hypothetical protein
LASRLFSRVAFSGIERRKIVGCLTLPKSSG